MSREPEPDAFREQVTALADEAVRILAELMRSSSSDPVRVAAARELIDRAHGKPKGEPAGDGTTLQDLVRNSFERKDP